MLNEVFEMLLIIFYKQANSPTRVLTFTSHCQIVIYLCLDHDRLVALSLFRFDTDTDVKLLLDPLNLNVIDLDQVRKVEHHHQR